MTVAVVIDGESFDLPEEADENWGDVVTSWQVAVSSKLLQKSGGTFTLGAELDFGASFGLKSLYYKSRGASPAAAGVFRMAKTEIIAWRNNLGTGDNTLTTNASDQLLYNGVMLATATVTWGGIAGTLSNQTDLQAALDAKVDSAGSSTNLAVPTWSGTGGDTLADSNVILSAASNLLHQSDDNVADAAAAADWTIRGSNKSNAGSSGDGGGLSIIAGSALGSGKGGHLFLSGGPSSGDAGGQGGAIRLQSGNASSATGVAADVVISVGTNGVSSVAGDRGRISLELDNGAMGCLLAGSAGSLGVRWFGTTRVSMSDAGGVFFDVITPAGGGTRRFIAINADITDSEGSGNEHDIGRDTSNNTYPYRSLYLGTSALIGATTGSTFTPTYKLQMRDSGANAVYTQWTNSVSGDTSTKGLLVGIDATAQGIFKLQPETTADATKAPSLTITAANKTAGTGDGGDITGQPGTSFGGEPGQFLMPFGATVSTSASKPTASAARRGQLWVVQGGAGVADKFQICLKDVADAYAWHDITFI